MNMAKSKENKMNPLIKISGLGKVPAYELHGKTVYLNHSTPVYNNTLDAMEGGKYQKVIHTLNKGDSFTVHGFYFPTSDKSKQKKLYLFTNDIWDDAHLFNGKIPYDEELLSAGDLQDSGVRTKTEIDEEISEAQEKNKPFFEKLGKGLEKATKVILVIIVALIVLHIFLNRKSSSTV